MSAGVVKVKGVEVELGGTVYVVPPLSLAALEQLEDRVARFDGNVFDREQRAIALDIIHAALRRNYPEMAREALSEMIDLGNMLAMVQAVMGASQIPASGQPPQDLAGNAPAVQ